MRSLRKAFRGARPPTLPHLLPARFVLCCPRELGACLAQASAHGGRSSGCPSPPVPFLLMPATGQILMVPFAENPTPFQSADSEQRLCFACGVCSPAGVGAPTAASPGLLSPGPGGRRACAVDAWGDRLATHYVDVPPGRMWKSSQVLGHLTPRGDGHVTGDGRSVPFHLQEETREPKRRRWLPPRWVSWTPAAAVRPQAQAGSPKRSGAARPRARPAVSCGTEDPSGRPSPSRQPRPQCSERLPREAPGAGRREGGPAAAPLELWLPRLTHCSLWAPVAARAEAQAACVWGLSRSRPQTAGPNPASRVPTPHPGAEQTEKADAPREPPPVEPKPDPTSSMAAAEAEAALSESSEQGTLPPGRAQPAGTHAPQRPFRTPPVDPPMSPL